MSATMLGTGDFPFDSSLCEAWRNLTVLRMALPKEFIQIGGLIKELVENEKQNEVLERLKLLAQENLPDGWIEWKVSQLSKAQLVGFSGSNDLQQIKDCSSYYESGRSFSPRRRPFIGEDI